MIDLSYNKYTMSSEHFSGLSKFSFQDSDNEKKRQSTDEFRHRVFAQIEHIERQSSYQGGRVESYEYAESRARVAQLEGLCSYTLQIIEEEISNETVYLDSTRFTRQLIDNLKSSNADFYYEHEAKLDKFTRQGTDAGTADFIELLVPPEIQDPTVRANYFSKDNRDAHKASANYLKNDQVNEPEHYIFETALADTYLHLSFDYGNRAPRRELFFIDRHDYFNNSAEETDKAKIEMIEDNIRSLIYSTRIQGEAHTHTEDFQSAEAIQADAMEKLADSVFPPDNLNDWPVILDQYRVDPKDGYANKEDEFYYSNLTQGEEMFLKNIVPANIDAQHREVYFLPWAKDMAMLIGDKMTASDDINQLVRFKTAIPGVYAYYAYSQGVKHPLRVIDTDEHDLSYEYFQNLVNESEENEISILETSDDVDTKIEDIFWDQPPEADLSDVDKTCEWLASKTRGHQLYLISKLTLEMARHNDHSVAIDVEDPQLLEGVEMPAPGFYEAYTTEAQAAINQGEKAGTNDFLEILAPDNIIDLDARRTHFSPWTRGAARKWAKRQGYTVDLYPNDSMQLSLPTKIPNVEILYFYPPETNIPKRTIQLKYPIIGND